MEVRAAVIDTGSQWSAGCRTDSRGVGDVDSDGGSVVLVPEGIAQSVLRIQAAFQVEQFLCSGIGAVELLGGRMQLVGEVISATVFDHCCDQFARPHADSIESVGARSLLVIQHKCKGLAPRPREQGAGIALGMPDGDIDDVDPMPLQDLGYGGRASLEVLDGNEIFLQDVGRGRALQRLQFGDAVARLVVAPMHDALREHERIDEEFTAPLAKGRFRNRPHDVFLHQMPAALPLQPGGRRDRAVRLAPSGRTHADKVGCVNVGIVEHGRRIVADVLPEESRVAVQGHLHAAAFDAAIFSELEFRFDDHAERAVASDAAVEDLSVLRRSGVDYFAADQHDADGSNRQHQRAQSDVAAM